MKSPEKVARFLEHLQEYSDRDIAEAVPLPVPPGILRLGLAGVAGQIPGDAEELDAMLDKLSEFALSLQSDPVHERAEA